MLGSVFYPDTGLKATVYDTDGNTKEGQEVRNALWVDVLKIVGGDVLKNEGRALPKDQIVRAKKAVVQLKLSYATNKEYPDADADEDINKEHSDEEIPLAAYTPKTTVPSDISTSSSSISTIMRSVVALIAAELPAFIAHFFCIYLIFTDSSPPSFFNGLAHAI